MTRYIHTSHVTRHGLTLLLCAGLGWGLFAPSASAQEGEEARKSFVLTGSVQSDMLVPTGEQKDGSDDHFRTNTYIDLNLQNSRFDLGTRFEYLEHPLPGFEEGFKGMGIKNSHIYARMRLDKVEVTLGNFYEQFGSGFVLRTYEERSLGIDGSLLGGRVVARPFRGIQLKALSGKQRCYWELNRSVISGADLELGLEQWIKPLADAGTVLTLGGSWVNKYEPTNREEDKQYVYRSAGHSDVLYQLRLPRYVNAFDVRAALQHHGFNLLAEYARKSQDPTADNGYTYHRGYVAMLSASYSQKGLSALLQAKRSDDFSFRSRRGMIGSSSMINHLPAFTQDHTYALASLYPYATQPGGEWAYQAQLGYTLKRGTALGGRYGTNLKANFSYVQSLRREERDAVGSSTLDDLKPGSKGTGGYSAPFWSWGDTKYYHDANVQMEKRFSRLFKLSLMYMNQAYNKEVIEREEGGIIKSNIFVAEGLFKFGSKYSLRSELQYLQTHDDRGDWLFGLAEFSLLPHWMFTVSDTYNCGTTKEHYWQLLATYNIKAHRIQAGWGRTREGFNCSGGVCRYIPETKGFNVSYNYNF